MTLTIDDADKIQKIIEKEMEGTDYWDIRISTGNNTSIELKDGELKKLISGSETGAGMRVLCNGAWGFGYTNDVTDKNIELIVKSAVKRARGISKKVKEKISLAPTKTIEKIAIEKPKKNPDNCSVDEKIALLCDTEKALREFREIITITTGYSDGTGKKLFMNSDGSVIITGRTMTFARAQFVVKKDGNITGGSERLGGTTGFELFDGTDFLKLCRDKVIATIRLLSADHAPGGRYPVVIDPELAGVFTHEAVGHATEGDLVTTGDSILENRIGEKIGTNVVTISDDPTMKSAFGSFVYDDEGTKAQKKVLIKNGVLKKYILNRETAHKLNMKPNGGARAESFASRPLVRMSNTVIENGDHSFDELLENIKFGIYAKGTRGGQVDTAKGTFQFSAQEAFLIENGEITKLLKDVSLSGATLDILQKIDAVGDDFRLGSPGFCGKGQIVPVCDGGPHVRIKEAIVGGR